MGVEPPTMPKIDISVRELVDMIARGELRLPELQRRYVWPATRVRDLLDSLYRGYPSGTILVWETDKNVPEKDMAIDQQPASAFQVQKLLLDGQQRLTSLYAIVRGQALKVRNKLKPIEIAFNVAHPEGPPSEASEVEDDQPEQMDDSENGSEPGEDLKENVIKARLRRRTFVVASKSILIDPIWIKVSDIFKEGLADWDLLKPLGFNSPDDTNYDLYSKRLQKVRAI